MIVGQASDSWRAIDRDPEDGSLWVASEENVSLLRVAETGERIVVVGPRVEGRGGFSQIRIASDAIYAVPTRAASAVWRLSREGKLLGQSFREEKEEEPTDAREVASRTFWLARDLDGNVVGLPLHSGQLYGANADGTWAALPDHFPARPPSHARSLRGEAVGTSSESWYFTDVIHGLFFLPGGPAVLGSRAIGLRSKGGTVFRAKDGRIEAAIEHCAENGLLMVVSDRSGFVGVSGGAGLIERSGARRPLPPQVIIGHFHAGT